MAAMTATQNQSDSGHRTRETPGDTLRTIIIVALIALTVRNFAFELFSIPSGSMMPGLQVGDYLLVSKYSYGYSSLVSSYGLLPFKGRIGGHAPERGDVVVFKLPTDPGLFKQDYIKRLIGLPGDVIAVKSGVVFINGKAAERERIGPAVMEERGGLPLRPATEYRETIAPGKSYVILQEYDNGALDNYGPTAVPEGHYFFMGDNRNNSSDSRTLRVGFVPEDNLVGPARFTVFSLTEDARFWQFWKWPFAIRWSRMFHSL